MRSSAQQGYKNQSLPIRCFVVLLCMLVLLATASLGSGSYLGQFTKRLSCAKQHNLNLTQNQELEIYRHPDIKQRVGYFLFVAKNFTPTTDKVTTHNYQRMYGEFLLPYYAAHPTMKMLEIGLGCDMNYGPGASVALWKRLFPNAQLWEADYDGGCVTKAQENGMLNGIHPLVGDQSNLTVLDGWIEKSGGNFDIIIDDGGHTNCMIKNSFDKLWPQIKPGGYYFIEDMQVGLQPHFNRDKDKCGGIVMSQVIADWTRQLLHRGGGYKGDHALPANLNFVHCQSEACVFYKDY